jgi:hypothetical protein
VTNAPPTPITLAVGLPAYGGKVDAFHFQMGVMLGHALAANEGRINLLGMGVKDENPIADARNLLVWEALKLEPSVDWFLMIDADTYHEGDDAGLDILRMIKAGHQLGAAIIGAPVRARGMVDHPRTVWIEDEVSRIQVAGRPAPIPSQSLASEDYYHSSVKECTRIGGAFTAVNLNWLRANMPDPPWYAHEPMMQGPPQSRLRGYGEDLSFCDRVRIRGGKIFVDGRFFPMHVMQPSRM